MNVNSSVCEMFELVFLLDCYRNEMDLENNGLEWNKISKLCSSTPGNQAVL